MTDEPTFDESGTDEAVGNEGPKALRDAYKRAAEERDQALSELNNLRREKLFDDAGIPNDKAGALLRKAYEGDSTIDAVKAAAVEYGILEPSTPPSAPAEELAAHQRTADLVGVTEPPPDLAAQIAAAKSPAELDALLGFS